MSGTETLVEIVMTIPAKKRDAWRSLPAARCLRELASLPEAEGRIELTENAKQVKLVAFFAEEAEVRAQLLMAAFGAAAPLGATGEGVCFVLVDYQRESGSALTIVDGSSTLTALSVKKARAKHRVLDAFLEKCVVPKAPPPAPGDSALEAAFQRALGSLRTLTATEIDGAWQHLKATTITNAAFAVTKKQEKQLLTLLESPPSHWEWAKVAPLRMLFPRQPEEMERTVLALLDRAVLKQQEHWMALEALGDSRTDTALERLTVALAGEPLLANAARRAIGVSVHPNATAGVLKLADEWLARAIANPAALTPAPNAIMAGAPPNEASSLLGLLQLRRDDACDDWLLRAWRRLLAERGRLTPDAASVAVQVAHTYVTSRCRALEPSVATSLLQRFPHMRITLEQAEAAIEELHKTKTPSRSEGGRGEK